MAESHQIAKILGPTLVALSASEAANPHIWAGVFLQRRFTWQVPSGSSLASQLFARIILGQVVGPC